MTTTIIILKSVNDELTNKRELFDALKNLDKTETWGVQIKKYNAKKTRSLEQNRYIHAICDGISTHVAESGGGYYIGVAYKHEFSLRHFGLVVEAGPNGELTSIKSTADLSPKDFAGLVEYIIQYAYDNYGEYEVETPEQYKKRKGIK